MAEDEAHSAPPRRGEPPLIGRARVTGWALIGAAALAAVLAREGPAGWSGIATGFAIGCGIIGLLCIVNVALVRSLYVQIDAAAQAQAAADASDAPGDDQSM